RVPLYQVVRRAGKIIWNPVSIQLAARSVQAGKMGSQTNDLASRDQDRLEDPGGQQRRVLGHGLGSQSMIKGRSGGSDQRCRLVQAFVPLPHRHAIDSDTTANAKLEPAVGEFEAADDHVEIRTSQRTDQADAARVSATRLFLEISDAVLSGDLGRTGHRPRWKCRSEDVGNGRLRLKLTTDSRDQVPDTRVWLDRQE